MVFGTPWSPETVDFHLFLLISTYFHPSPAHSHIFHPHGVKPAQNASIIKVIFTYFPLTFTHFLWIPSNFIKFHHISQDSTGLH